MARECKRCGTSFVPTTHNGLFCSRRCYSQRQNLPEWDTKPRRCAGCATVFVPMFRTQEHCSPRCRQRMQPARNRPCKACGGPKHGPGKACRTRTLKPCPRCGKEFWPWAPTKSGRSAHARTFCKGCVEASKARGAERRAKRQLPRPPRLTEAERKERSRQAAAMKYARDPEGERARVAAYKRAHPERRCEWGHRRRVAMRAGYVEPVDLAKVRRSMSACPYCGARLGAKVSVDHIVPVALGGEHSKRNVVPCCQSCNSSKRDLHPLEWVAKLTPARRDAFLLLMRSRGIGQAMLPLSIPKVRGVGWRLGRPGALVSPQRVCRTGEDGASVLQLPAQLSGYR